MKITFLLRFQNAGYGPAEGCDGALRMLTAPDEMGRHLSYHRLPGRLRPGDECIRVLLEINSLFHSNIVGFLRRPCED